MTLRGLAAGVLAAAGIVLSGMANPGVVPAAQDNAHRPPESTTIRALDQIGNEVLLRFTHEVLVDPEEVFEVGHITNLALHADGTQFYLDSQVKSVHIVDPNGLYKGSFAREGEGPGELQNPWIIGLSPADEIFVLDRNRQAFEIYTTSGEFKARARVPIRIRSPSSFVFLDETTIVLTEALTIPEQYGYAVHVFTVQELPDQPAGRRLMIHERSFGSVERFAPRFFSRVGGAQVRLDLDGGLLFNQRAPYSLRKYSASGELLWQIDDPDTLPNPITEGVRLTENGGTMLLPYPFSVFVLPVQKGLYFHYMIFPDVSFVDDTPIFGARTTQGELLWVRNGRLERQVRFTFPEPLHYAKVDSRGRFYGTWSDDDPIRIRSTLEIRER